MAKHKFAKPFTVKRSSDGSHYDVYDREDMRYVGLVRCVKVRQWYFNTRRGDDGMAASKEAAAAVVWNTMQRPLVVSGCTCSHELKTKAPGYHSSSCPIIGGQP